MGRPCVRSTGYWKTLQKSEKNPIILYINLVRKRRMGSFIHVYSHWLSPLPFVLNSTSHHDYLSTHKKISVRSSLSSLLTPSPHFRSYLNITIHLGAARPATLCAIPHPGYSYQAPLLHDICKATSALLLSGSPVQVGWIPCHTGITGNKLADAAAKLAAESTPKPLLDGFPWSCSRLCTQVHSQLRREWQT